MPPLPAGRARYGVLGQPIAHSLSPFLHHAGFAALGLDAEYLRIEVSAEDLGLA
ncbi:shikimate dehydrogenase, partial [bacterium]|nr:shikimate dehydrogenase [bacterium]